MTILFICGSLEPGRDGVGDYTRRLAGELIRQGHVASMLAYNDKHIQKIEEGTQTDEQEQIYILRLPADLKVKEKQKLAKVFINQQNPEWLSLQYVPYAFQIKGLPFRLGYQLKKLGKDKKWHVMFHEMWVGISTISPIKHKIIGFFQKQIAQNLIRDLNVSVNTTSNHLYQLVLETANISSLILPLFSNIEITSLDTVFVDDFCSKLQIDKSLMKKKWFIAGIFGTIYPQAKLEDTLHALLLETKKQDKQLALITFGRVGNNGQMMINQLKSRFSNDVLFSDFGEQNAIVISKLLQMLNVGISCTPFQHLGKSGVYAAMKYHGLRVINSSRDTLPEYNTKILSFFEEMELKKNYMWGVKAIGNELINILNQ